VQEEVVSDEISGSDELTEEELAAYGAKPKRKSVSWSEAALRILTDRKPTGAFMPDEDDDD
jgi:hypothetical protein